MPFFYQPAFKPVSPDAHQLTTAMSNDLDRRKAGLKDANPDDIQRIVCSYAAQGKNEFQVLLKHVPEQLKDAVSNATECLVRSGWMQRTSGKHGYRINPDHDLGAVRFQTVDDLGKWRIETRTGCVILDDSYSLRPLDDLAALNHRSIVFLEMPQPEKQLTILQGWTEAPSRRWYSLDDTPPDAVPQPEDWPQFVELIQKAGDMRGRHPFVPYEHEGKRGFLTSNTMAALRIIENASHRHWGRRCMPLLISTDPKHMRVQVHPGLQA